MGISYSDIIDPQVIMKIAGADYQNEARVINSGIIRKEGVPPDGTHQSWIKNTLFSGDEAGQAIGIDTDITLRSKVQVRYQLPIFDRADGAELDDISEEYMAKRTKEGVEADLATAITAKAAQMTDTALVSILDGSARFIISNANNYVNANGSQVNLVDLEETKATRGENGQKFESGFMIMRGLMYHQIGALGMIAATSNTLGNMKQDEIVRNGLKGTILGMNPFVTDKIALESTGGVDHIIILVERASLRVMLGAVPEVDTPLKNHRSWKSTIKFKVKIGGVFEGLSWGATQSNTANTTNTALQTATNWSLAATNVKNVPMACVRFDAPTF